MIARLLGRHPTTVAREVHANGGRHRYRPAIADRRSQQSRQRPRQHVLARPGRLRDRVTAERTVGRSPEAIYADLDAEHAGEVVCIETSTPPFTRVCSLLPPAPAYGCLDRAADHAEPVTPTSARAWRTSLSARPWSTTGSSPATGSRSSDRCRQPVGAHVPHRTRVALLAADHDARRLQRRCCARRRGNLFPATSA